MVKDLTDGAGDEKVLPPSRPDVGPSVADVPAPEEAACDCAISECARSCSPVETVGATERAGFAAIGSSSIEDLNERRLRSMDDSARPAWSVDGGLLFSEVSAVTP